MGSIEKINPDKIETKKSLSDNEIMGILSESQFFNDLNEEAALELIEIIKSQKNKK